MSDRDPKIEQWAATEKDLRVALAGVDVRSETANQVTEYLDHNELSLAFELLVFELDRLGVSTPEVVMGRLWSAADRIGPPEDHDDREAWERVQRRSRS